MTSPLMPRKTLFEQGQQNSPVSHPAEDVRLTMAGLWTPDASTTTASLSAYEGVVWGPGAMTGTGSLAVSSPGAGQLTVQPGRWVVQSNTGLAGAYWGTVDNATTVVIPSGSYPTAGQFKAGVVLIRVYDTVYSDVQDGWTIETLLGNPASTAGTAVLPTPPATSIVLKNFTIDGSGTITLSGSTTYTVPANTVLYCTSLTRPTTPFHFQEIFETDSLLRRRWDGTQWEIVSWHGTDRTIGGGLPGFAVKWTNASITDGTTVTLTNWTQVYNPASVFSGLFSYTNSGTKAFTVNAKGKLRVTLTTYSDTSSGAGYSQVYLIAPNSGIVASLVDERHRNSGYAGCGTVQQIVDTTLPVMPGDTFGVQIAQHNTSGVAVTYQVSLNAQFL